MSDQPTETTDETTAPEPTPTPASAGSSPVVRATAAATRYGWSRNDRSSAILSFDETGTVIYLSPNGRELLGTETSQDAHESFVRRIVVDDEVGALRDALRSVAGREAPEATVTLHLDDGKGGNPIVEITAMDLREDPAVRGLVATVSPVAST